MNAVFHLRSSGDVCDLLMDNATVYFLVQKLADLPEDLHWLAAGELARVAAFRFPKRRNDWLVGRWTAKRALRSHLILEAGTAPGYSAIEIRSAPDGAPEAFISGNPAPVSLALSHSGEEGFCAVAAAGCVLGCDLEMVQPHDEALVRDYFCAEERLLVVSAPVAERPFLITLIWSAKESALKCLREGLRRDTRSVLVEIAGQGLMHWNPLTVRCRESSRTFYGWWRNRGSNVQTIAAGRPLPEPVELPLF